ncbi:hypothetical protein GMRT_10621 [Giardia muris]|uniref:Uncharacterized protein n=1 Tax=Giardia muris TaxID=5742 RepID=A0A4Z1SMJ7_GIAMU|nr:hypothetical protein GMRT_10621 [Giardia muris]|eukprot:TNJ26800.1 hypothetical protein GMRT_10621 [Giardia muris]
MSPPMISRVGYLPSLAQELIGRGEQQVIYVTPPRFYSRGNPHFSAPTQLRTVYRRPERFQNPAPSPVVHTFNLPCEGRGVTTERPYPHAPFYSTPPASVACRAAKSALLPVASPPETPELPQEESFRELDSVEPLVEDDDEDSAFSNEIAGFFITEAPLAVPEPKPVADPETPIYPKSEQLVSGTGTLTKAVFDPAFMRATDRYSRDDKMRVVTQYTDEYINHLPSSTRRTEKRPVPESRRRPIHSARSDYGQGERRVRPPSGRSILSEPCPVDSALPTRPSTASSAERKSRATKCLPNTPLIASMYRVEGKTIECRIGPGPGPEEALQMDPFPLTKHQDPLWHVPKAQQESLSLREMCPFFLGRQRFPDLSQDMKDVARKEAVRITETLFDGPSWRGTALRQLLLFCRQFITLSFFRLTTRVPNPLGQGPAYQDWKLHCEIILSVLRRLHEFGASRALLLQVSDQFPLGYVEAVFLGPFTAFNLDARTLRKCFLPLERRGIGQISERRLSSPTKDGSRTTRSSAPPPSDSSQSSESSPGRNDVSHVVDSSGEYLAVPAIEVFISVLSMLEHAVPTLSEPVEVEGADLVGLLVNSLALMSICDPLIYQWMITPIIDISAPPTSRLRVQSVRSLREAPVVVLIDYVCHGMLRDLIASYDDASLSHLHYLNCDTSIEGYTLQTPPISWGVGSLLDVLIGPISRASRGMTRERFSFEHEFLLSFKASLGFRPIEAVALVLFNMPPVYRSAHFSRLCLLLSLTLTYVKGLVISSASQKILGTIFQGCRIREPFLLANCIYLLAVCIGSLIVHLIQAPKHVRRAHADFLSHVIADSSLICDILVNRHCISFTSGLELRGMSILFNSLPGTVDGSLPPFIFFPLGSKREGDVVIDPTQASLFLHYYVAVFAMRLSITACCIERRLRISPKACLRQSLLISLGEEYARYRGRYALVESFCATICEDHHLLDEREE